MSNFNSRSFTIEGDDGEINLDILNQDDKDASLKDAIIDLYLNVKIRNSDDVSRQFYLHILINRYRIIKNTL